MNDATFVCSYLHKRGSLPIFSTRSPFSFLLDNLEIAPLGEPTWRFSAPRREQDLNKRGENLTILGVGERQGVL